MDKQLKALITLLDDPDPVVAQEVEKNLMNRGVEVVPDLEKAWETNLNKTIQRRLEDLIDDIQFTRTKEGLKDWVKSPGHDLLEGMFWLATYQYPDLQKEEVFPVAERIVAELREHNQSYFTPLERVKTFNHVLYTVNNFVGSRTGFFTPQNFFVNNLLERRKGNPITLGLFYIYLAQQLNMPVYGLNLPVNFLVAFVDSTPIREVSKPNILFFINPFNNGMPLGLSDLEYFLDKQKIQVQDMHFTVADNVSLIQRLLANLIFAYEKLGFPDKVNALKKLGEIMNA